MRSSGRPTPRTPCRRRSGWPRPSRLLAITVARRRTTPFLRVRSGFAHGDRGRMTDHEEHQETAPAPARDPRSDAELDAIAEAEVEGLPVSTHAALRTPPHGGGRVQGGGAGALPRGPAGDQRDILGGAGQNVIGLAAGVLTTFATQVIMTRGLGPALFGVVTLTTQFAFIASTATRFGMDVANVRLVAILIGRGESGRTRPLVRTSAII